MGLMIEGNHDAKVVDVAMRSTQDGESGVISITFQNEAGDTAEFAGFLSERGWPWAEKALQALGWDPATNDYRLDLLVGERPIMGRTANVKVQHEDQEWKDKTTGEPKSRRVARIAFVNGPGGPRMSREEASAFADKMRAKLRVWGGRSAPSASAPPSPVEKAFGATAHDPKLGF